MKAAGLTLVVGGTFDPIHHGHLRMALELTQQFPAATAYLTPVGQAPHRQAPHASPAQRLAMVEQAVYEETCLQVSDFEVRRCHEPSYSLLTLQHFRASLGDDAPLCLVLGADAFAQFHKWHGWLEIPSLAHIMVVNRPDCEAQIPSELSQFVTARTTADAMDLLAQPAGSLFFAALTPLAISSTSIRAQLAQGQSPRYLLPDAVLDYIDSHNLYTPNLHSQSTVGGDHSHP